MPKVDLANGPQSLLRYDVIGKCAGNFVTHVALLDTEQALANAGADVPVVHMAPPFKKGTFVTAHVAATVPLDNEEIKAVAAWVDGIKDEYDDANVGARSQYVIDPPWEDVVDANTGVRRYRRYSCAGFVIDSHREVDINLVNINRNGLPDIDRDTLSLGYPLRPAERFGLPGDGPWKIVLAGYVLHALNRPAKEIRCAPYQPKEGDEFF
jgi:hypothetical protein